MKLTELKPVMCESFPVPREPGILYVSKKYDCVTHLCPCGCGSEVVTPLEVDELPGWKIGGTDDSVTLSPSIFCLTECGSHYFIRANQVEWC